jgi:hypothetical protein
MSAIDLVDSYELKQEKSQLLSSFIDNTTKSIPYNSFVHIW